MVLRPQAGARCLTGALVSHLRLHITITTQACLPDSLSDGVQPGHPSDPWPGVPEAVRNSLM